jgi:hypothetical protein
LPTLFLFLSPADIRSVEDPISSVSNLIRHTNATVDQGQIPEEASRIIDEH